MTTRENDPGDPGLSAVTLVGAEVDLPPDARTLPTLTILAHPDLRRVGEVARLYLPDERPAALSRAEPRFGPPGRTAAEPLADPFLSRHGASLARSGDGVRLAAEAGGASLVVGDRVVTGEAEVTARELAEGVVLELGGRVVLLLHGTHAGRRARAPSLGLVGESEALERVRAEVVRVADLDVPVLIRGETGTGKELVARAIHARSRRRERPCVSVNMATVPESLAASELFGHARGAFSGAVREAPGYFALADGGTLFLDEVGDAPAAVQSMLLRVLETGEVHPVGAGASRRVDVRLVAATDADLEAGVRGGRFGAALLHRLAGFEIALPPLRARREDVGRLLVHFLREELAATGESARLEGAAGARPFVPASLVAALARYDWPGNVRQLHNVVRQLVISNRGEERLRLNPSVERLLAAAPTGPSPAPAAAPARRRPAQVTDAELVAALRAHGWRREPTARDLGIAVSSLYGLIERCALLRKASEIGRDELARCRAECGGDLARMSARLEVSTRGLQLRMRELGLA